jgi:uncharacterized protein (DUF1499 family)
MKLAFIIIIMVIGSSIVLLFILGKYSQKGQAPGLVNGSLSRCPEKPNCVCSEYKDDVDHYIEPITAHQNDMPKVVSTIIKLGGNIQIETDNYIAATFKSSIFGFVDDLEIRMDPIHGVMHFRSASRVGYDDMGVNRNRVESFKILYFE